MIIRLRGYSSLLEAEEEWKCFGLGKVADSADDLFGSRFFFAEGREQQEIADLAFAAEDRGGDAWRCDSLGVFRAMLAFEPEMLQPINCGANGADPLSVIRRVQALYNRTEAPELRWKGGKLGFDSTRIMGVLNVTPDSFSDGGRHLRREDAVRRGLEMAEQGADIIDVGGESTRPNARPVSTKVEKERIMPVIEDLASEITIPISVDTRHPGVAEAALGAGASIINDVGGLREPGMIEVVVRSEAPIIMMHMQGGPTSMQRDPQYFDVVGDICLFFEEGMKQAMAQGLERERVMLDPGLGFGKTVQHNLDIIRRLREFSCLERPLMIGASRKGFIGKLLGTEEDQRLEGSLAAAAAAIMNGASIVRAHDVQETKRVARVIDALKRK